MAFQLRNFVRIPSKKGFCNIEKTAQNNPSPQRSPLKVYADPQSAPSCPRFGWGGGVAMVCGASLPVAIAAGGMSPGLAPRGMLSGSAAQALVGLASAAGREKPIHRLRSPSSGAVDVPLVCEGSKLSNGAGRPNAVLISHPH